MRPNRYFSSGLKRMRQGNDEVFRAADGSTIFRAQEGVTYNIAGKDYLAPKWLTDWIFVDPQGKLLDRHDSIWDLGKKYGYEPQFYEEWSGKRLENPHFRIGVAHLTRGTKFRVSSLVGERDEKYGPKDNIFTVDHIVQCSDGHTLIVCCEVDIGYSEIVHNKEVTRETPVEEIHYKYKQFDKHHVIEIVKAGCGFVKESMEDREVQEPDDDFYWRERVAFEKDQLNLRNQAAELGLTLKKSELVFRGDLQIGNYIADKFGHLYSTGQSFDQERLVRFLMKPGIGQVKVTPLHDIYDRPVQFYVIKRKQFDKLVRRNLNRFAANWSAKLKLTRIRDEQMADEMVW